MNLLNKIFKKKDSSGFVDNTIHPDKLSKGVPVNKSIWFLTHTESIKKEFGFLESDLGFEIKTNGFQGHEYWVVYSKNEINIEIWGDYGDLPYVIIRNKAMPYDESKQLFNSDIVDEYNSEAKKIRQSWTVRRNPIQKIFSDKWSKNNIIDLTELEKDYEEYGKHEHIEYLKQASLTVKENLELNKGILKNVP